MNDKSSSPIDVTTPPDIAAIPPKKLAENIKDNTNNEFGDLNTEVGGTGIIAIIMKFLKDPKAFFASLFGKESKDEESENESKWEAFTDSPMFAFFEKMKETFSLTQANTSPEVFNEKFEDANFKKIMEFQKKSGEIYSPESLAILWSNKENLEIKDGDLVIKKKSGELQAVDTKNNESIAESIIPQKSVSDRIPAFTNNLETSFAKNFSDIPPEYKSKIPEAMEHFRTNLQNAVAKGEVPKFTKERIIHSIEATFSIPWYAKSTINNKIDTFLTSTDGINLKGQYKDLWKA